MQLVEKVVCLSLHQNPFVVPFCILAFRFLLFISMGTDQHKPSKVWAIKNRQKIQFYLFVFFSCIFHYLCTICCVINFINNLIFFPSVLPSEFWREALPRALKACFGPRFFSVKLQLLATLLGLASAPSSGPGDWAFPLVTGALEGLGNTLSFRLAFRLRGGRQPQREFNPFNGPCGSVSRMWVCFLFFVCPTAVSFDKDNNLWESSPMLFRALTSAAAQ